MRIGDFDFYRDYLKNKAGLVLTSDKSYLLVSRLTPVSKKWGYPTLEAMTMGLRGMPDVKLVREMIEAMVDGDTAFFRDPQIFEHLRTAVAPRLMKKRKKKDRLRVWSAGCATGQEAWSIAVALSEADPPAPADILATDISDTLLTQAKQAEYPQFEAQRGLPMPLLIKYFDPLPGDVWSAGKSLRSMVTFTPFNLLDKMTKMGAFDIIFCRYVLDDFDPAARRQILAGLAACLVPDGVLVLSPGEKAELIESLTPLTDAPGFFTLK